MGVCSNEMLKTSMDSLAASVRENNKEQKQTRSALDQLKATFATWRTTRCDDHHSRLDVVETAVQDQGRSISKAVGVILAIMVFIQIGGLAISFFAMKAAIGG